MSLDVFRPHLSDLVITWYVIRIQSQIRTNSQSPFRGFHVSNVELNFTTNKSAFRFLNYEPVKIRQGVSSWIYVQL